MWDSYGDASFPAQQSDSDGYPAEEGGEDKEAHFPHAGYRAGRISCYKELNLTGTLDGTKAYSTGELVVSRVHKVRFTAELFRYL